MIRPFLQPGARALLFTLAAVLFAGCVRLHDPEASQEYRSEVIANIAEGMSFGQSFISRRTGLDSVELWLAIGSQTAADGTLVAELFSAPGEAAPLAVAQVPVEEASSGNPVRFEFPTQHALPNQSYYLLIKTQNGSLQVFGRGEDAYPGGSAFLNGAPLAADASFRLTYSYSLAELAADARRLPGDLWLVLPLGIVLLLPGWLLLSLAGIGRHLDLGQKAGLAVGLSLAILPLLMLWTTLAHLTWSRSLVLAAAGILMIGAAWWTGRALARWSREAASRRIRPAGSNAAEMSAGRVPGSIQAERAAVSSLGPSLALVAVFLFTLALRLVMVRDLAAPAWVDSVHHALIARLIVAAGGFPDTYAPYLELGSTAYHPGFHALLAVFHWLSGLEIPQAMLLLGQVLNALIVFAVYLFATSLVRTRPAIIRWTGVFAALIAGVFTPMPAYYTSWGRYTQLVGLLILPAAYALTDLIPLRIRPAPPGHGYAKWVFQNAPHQLPPALLWKTLLIAGTACAGLLLAHYRVLAFLAVLLAADFLTRLLAAAVEPIRQRLLSLFRIARLPFRNGPARPAPGGENALTPLIPASTLSPSGFSEPVLLSPSGGSLDRSGPEQAKPDEILQVEPAVEQLKPLDPTQPARLRDSLLLRAVWTAVLAGLALLFTLPWWPGTLRSFILPTAALQTGAPPTPFADFNWSYLDAGLGRYTLILAGLGLVLGLLMARRFVLTLLIWTALLFGLANLAAIGLPWGGFINNTSVEITLFLPIAVLDGYLLARILYTLANRLAQRWRTASVLVVAIATMGLSLAGARHVLPILNPVTFLFRAADRPALAWVADNLPAQAVVLVNPFSWGYGLYAGNDGGYWISPISGRQTMPPPVLYGYNSQAADIHNTNAVIQAVMAQTGDPPALQETLRQAGIAYVYIGARGGVLSPRRLLESGLFEPLYAQDGTWVFRVR